METPAPRLQDVQALAKLVGESPALLKTIEQLPAMAGSGAAVLITGETGTGKELVARALHYLSKRASFPFVPVNCGSLSDALLEGELFGHERGAFTGAHIRRKGLIAQAEQGTLFLDEVNSLTLKAQTDLLRVLQDNTFRLVGSSIEQHADVRILAATNAPLKQQVLSGSFRADLYYRLCVFSITLLPLRDRKEDILALADHFLKKHTPVANVPFELAPTARAALVLCEWPGNIRELENAVIRGIHLTKTNSIGIEDLGLQCKAAELTSPTPVPPAQRRCFSALKRAAIETFERQYLTRIMSEYRGNVSHAARAAGKDRRDFGKLLKKHLLNPRAFSPPGSPSPE
ncbi:MAG: sigma-54 dependent transcriptional regulator [Terriglobia bacterium]